MSELTIGRLREIIRDLPDETPVIGQGEVGAAVLHDDQSSVRVARLRRQRSRKPLREALGLGPAERLEYDDAGEQMLVVEFW